MQGGRSASAVESAKEAAANVGASAWAGKEKTKAVVQAAVDKARAPDAPAKDAADARKAERIRDVEATKRHAMRANAAAKEHATAATATYHPSSATDGGVAGRAMDEHSIDSGGVAPGDGAMERAPAATSAGVAPGDGYPPASTT
uniref:Uncharacterized protein n=1 Tax=Leersia perrieri TaxID=77586 RepID=A0A0D9XBX6_9ORYZ